MSDDNLCLYEDYIENYKRVGECGRGKFGTVYKVEQWESGKMFASKHVRFRKKEQKQKVLNEIGILKKISNPQIVKFVEAFKSFNEIIIITEYLNGGELFDRIASEEMEITEQACCLYLRQICRGAEYLHSQNILHLDLKPENIVCLSKEATNVKIIDFGTAKLVPPGEKIKVICGTPEFVSPEVVNYDAVSQYTDMWSIGVITYILLSGFSPFMGDTDSETFSNIIKVVYDFDEPEFDLISTNAKNFISNLFMLRPSNRLSASQCLEHPWLLEQDIGHETLSKTKLRQFIARRKWQRAGHAIRAMSRMSEILVRRRSQRSSVPETSSPFREKLEFSKRSTEKKYNSLSPSADFNSLMLQQEFAKTQPSIEEETDDRVSLRELDQGDDRARLPDLVQEIMLNPKLSPKESRSNNFQEKEKKDRSRGIQTNLIARNMVKSRIAMFERKQSLQN